MAGRSSDATRGAARKVSTAAFAGALGVVERRACYARSVTTQELMQAVLALPEADLEALRDAIDERLAAPVEVSPELIAMLEERSRDRSPGIPMDEALALLRRR